VNGSRARTASWVVLAVVLAGALVVGAGDGSPPTDAERASRIAQGLRCPTCRSQSVADSDAPAARAMREDIERRVREGQAEAQIRAYLVSRYGEQVRLAPPVRGTSALVWVLPPVAVAVTVAALAVAFRRRWRPTRRRASAEDRALVEEALSP
jgi:cytochrome c-type biogenesis protein CcmH